MTPAPSTEAEYAPEGEWPVVAPAPPSPGAPGRLWGRLRSVLPGLIGLSLAASFMAWRGRPHLAAVIATVAVVLVAAGLVTPMVGQALERVVERVGHWVGRVLTVVLLGSLWIVVVVPAALLNRLVRIDLLAFGSALPGWRLHDWTGLDRRQYGREPRFRGRSMSRVARVGVVVGLLAAVAVPVYHRIEESRRVPAFTALAPRASEDLEGADVATDEWVVTVTGLRVSRQTFPNEPWGADVIEEHKDPAQLPDSRLGWINNDRRGRYVNVVDGRRVTSRVEDPELSVWLFGGSTAYGVGQRDGHTIASNLVREAAADGRSVEVVNFGVAGYVNHQEAEVFAEQLRAGERADVAVFLDGVNEMALAWERERYGLLDSSEPLTLAISALVQAEREEDARRRGYIETHEIDRQVRMAAEQYGASARRVLSLGEQYDVPVLLFWQPSIQTMEAGAPGLATVLNNLELEPDSLPDTNRAFDEAARRSGVEPIDLTDLFDDADQPIFFDWSHTNEAGARIEAAAMYEHLEPLLERAERG